MQPAQRRLRIPDVSDSRTQKNTVKFNMVLFTLLISELALNMLFFFKGNIKLSHQINAQSPIPITSKAPAGLTAAQFVNLSHLQSSRNALHSFLYACAYLVVLMLLTGPFIMPYKEFLTNCCVGYCLHWNIYAFSCRSGTPTIQCKQKALKKISQFRSGEQRTEPVHSVFSSSLHSSVTEVHFERFLSKLKRVQHLVGSA